MRNDTMLFFFQRLIGKRDLLLPYFDLDTIVPGADRAALLTRIGRLRYEVYCEERAFLDACAYPDGIEADAYDAGAAHVAACALDGDLVGTVRLVRPGKASRFPSNCSARCSTAWRCRRAPKRPRCRA